MFSNAYSNAAAIPQGCTSIPLPNRLLRTLNQPGGSGSHPTEHAPRINSDVSDSNQGSDHHCALHRQFSVLKPLILGASLALTKRNDCNRG